MVIKEFFDDITNTFTYLVYCVESKEALVIDPALEFDPSTKELTQDLLDKVINEINSNDLNLKYIFETHMHADHLTGGKVLKQLYPKSKWGINENIIQVQSTFCKILNIQEMKCDGSQFDLLLKDKEKWSLGSQEIEVIFTPGHTPTCTCFLIAGNLFTGDTIFMPDFGSGRCDFPNGNAEDLYDSIQNRVFSLDPSTKIFVGHDYGVGGREILFQTTVGQQMKENIHFKDRDKEKFVSFRNSRDANLDNPKLLFPSVQFNMNGGVFPVVEDGEIIIVCPSN